MTTRFRRTAAFAVTGAMILGLSMPVAAQQPPVDAQQPAAATALAGVAAASAAEAPKARKYCIKERATGSNMLRKICKSAEDWAARGVDVGAK